MISLSVRLVEEKGRTSLRKRDRKTLAGLNILMIKINQNYQLLVSEIYTMLKISHMWKNIHAVCMSTEDIFLSILHVVLQFNDNWHETVL